jgi:hypothetical protein
MYFQGASNKIDKVKFDIVLSIACMLNPSLEKSLKRRVKSKIKAIFRPDERASH